MRFLKPIHDAADCLRRFAHPIAHRIGLPRTNGFRGAIFACATHEKRREAILETGLRTRDAVCGDSPVRSRAESDCRTPTAFAAQYLPAQSARRSTVRFLKPVHDAADCLRRFAHLIARRIGLPRANGFRGAIFACATHEKRRGAILETGLRTRDAVRGDSLVRSRAESDCRAPTAFAALRYGLSVQFLEKAVRFLQRRRFYWTLSFSHSPNRTAAHRMR